MKRIMSIQTRWKVIMFTAGLFLFSTSLCYPEKLTLEWDPSPGPDLAGYKIYYGTKSGEYDSVNDVGPLTEYTIRGLQPEVGYYFVLTAYDTTGEETEVIGKDRIRIKDQGVKSWENAPELLSEQIEALNRILLTNNAALILRTVRTQERILAQSDFEARIERRIENTEKRIDTLQYWIWGTLLTLIGGLIGVVIFLSRRLGRLLAVMPKGDLVHTGAEIRETTIAEE